MWFLTDGLVVSVPMILAELPERKNCGSFFKKHNRHGQVQFFDKSRGFFSCLHLAVGHHQRRKIPRCSRGLQLSRVEVFLADHMHTSWILPQSLFPPALLLMQPGVPNLPRVSRMQPCFFFELVCVFSYRPCFASGASLLSFTLFLRSVLKFHSVGTALTRNFEYFSKRWSLIFPDTCLTWRRLCESYSSNWSQNFLHRVFHRLCVSLRFQWFWVLRHSPIVVQFVEK